VTHNQLLFAIKDMSLEQLFETHTGFLQVFYS